MRRSDYGLDNKSGDITGSMKDPEERYSILYQFVFLVHGAVYPGWFNLRHAVCSMSAVSARFCGSRNGFMFKLDFLLPGVF